MIKKVSFLVSAAIALFLITGCATIIHGTRQSVAISSNPSKAVVTIDGQERGSTPLTVDLKRNDTHSVKIELDGYLPYELNLNKKVDGWIAGNIIFGGLIGLAVDAITGGMYKLSPDEIMAELKSSSNTAHVSKKDNIVVFVTMTPNPEWDMIGCLQAE